MCKVKLPLFEGRESSLCRHKPFTKIFLIFIDPPYDIDNSVISENLFDCMDMINEEIIVLERSSMNVNCRFT